MGPRLFSRGNGNDAFGELQNIPASMGPRLFSRGNHIICLYIVGDISLLQWDHGFLAVETEYAGVAMDKLKWASMGPRLFSRGNGNFVPSFEFQCDELQWGHGFLAVETELKSIVRQGIQKLQWGHGFLAVETGACAAALYRRLECFNGATAF